MSGDFNTPEHPPDSGLLLSRDVVLGGGDTVESAPGLPLLNPMVPPGFLTTTDTSDVADEIEIITDLDVLAGEINESHRRGMLTFLENARRTGDLLLQVKDRIPHGAFTGWVEQNCEFGPETARGYMRVAEHWDTLLQHVGDKRQRVADLSLRSALQILKKGRTRAEERSGNEPTDGREPVPGDAPALRVEDAGEPQIIKPAATDQPETTLAAEEERPGGIGAVAQADHDGLPYRTDPDAELSQYRNQNGPDHPLPPSGDPEPVKTSAGSPPAGTDLDRETSPEDVEGQTPDTEWLDTLPARHRIADTTQFDQDALLWRRVRPAVDDLVRRAGFTPDALRHAAVGSRFARNYRCLVGQIGVAKHPRFWKPCIKCQGACINPVSKIACGLCDGAGFEVVKEGDPAAPDQGDDEAE